MVSSEKVFISTTYEDETVILGRDSLVSQEAESAPGYALATFAGKLLLPVLNRIEKGKKFLDLVNKPFLALGWLSVVIITVLFAVGAIVKVCL
jgi:hypothetical protein